MVKSRRGVSLIELILTLALIGVILQVAYSVFFVGNTSYSVSTNKGFSQQDVRSAGDFITSELKYITNINTDLDIVKDHFTGNYYSLKIEKDLNSAVLVRTYHEYLNNGELDYDLKYDEDEDKFIIGNWDSFRITNITNGIINVVISQEEGNGNQKSGYELPFNIILANNTGLSTNIDVDLMTDGAIIYYNKAKDTVVGNIDIAANIEDPEEENPIGQATILFDSKGGSVVTSITQNIGTEATIPANPTRDGYIFSRWNTESDDSGTIYVEGNKLNIPINNITLYAIWNVNYTLPTISTVTLVKINDSSVSSTNSITNRYDVKKNKKHSIQVKVSGNNLESIVATLLSEENVINASINEGKTEIILNFIIDAPNDSGIKFDKTISFKSNNVLIIKKEFYFQTVNS